MLSRIATLKQLHAFHTVARLGSISQAAQILHLTQSAISIQIASIEQKLGTPLLTRTGRGMRLTEAGVMLQAYAERVIDLWGEMGDSLGTYVGAFAGTLRVGAVATTEYWLPSLLVAYTNENPKAKVKLHVGNRDEMVRSLESREIDVAVMGNPPDSLKPTSTRFAKNLMGFLASPAHPLIAESNVTMARLAQEPMLVRERGSGSRATLTQLFMEAGHTLRIGSEFASNEAIKQMCMAGFGPAYLSLPTCILEMRASLLTLLPMEGNIIEREWFVAHLPTTKPLPQMAITFERFLRQNGQKKIDQLLALPEALPGMVLKRKK